MRIARRRTSSSFTRRSWLRAISLALAACGTPFISSPKVTLPSAVRQGNSCAKSWNTTPRSESVAVDRLAAERISPPVGLEEAGDQD